MQNLLEIQNALRSAPDQQLMSLMQGANSSVPQWAVASEMNSRKEMRDEQTRQEGLGQPTVLAQLTGAAPASTPQANVAGMPQGIASGMAQSMAPKTDTDQNTGVASIAKAAAPVATMASGGILKMAGAGIVELKDRPPNPKATEPIRINANSEKIYTITYPEDMNKPSFEIGEKNGVFPRLVTVIRMLGGTIAETATGKVVLGDTAEDISARSMTPLDAAKIALPGIYTEDQLKRYNQVDSRSGLERLEAENEANLPEDMQRKLDVLELARTGAGAAAIADSLGMELIDVIDMGMGALGNGTLRASALAQDIQAWLAGTVIGNAPAAEELAKNATAMREFADGLFYKDDNWMPRASNMIENVFNISNSGDAAAAELAAYQTALDTKTANPEIRAKINAMPESSAVFAEGSPTQYTPAGLATLNREYGPADEDMSKMTGQVQGVYDARKAIKDKARFSGSPYEPATAGNINEYVSGVAALDNRTDRADPALAGVSSLPSNFPVAPPAPMLPQATIAADMATNVEGADTYGQGIATAINDVQREVPSGTVTAQTDANSKASLDGKTYLDEDPMTLEPYRNPNATEPQTELKYSPVKILETFLTSVKERDAAADERRAEKARTAELEKSAAETKLVYGDTAYTKIPDVPLTAEAKGVLGDLTQKEKGLAAVRPMSTSGLSRANAVGEYEQKLLDILDKREKSANQDKWLGLAEMGMRLMSSTNPNALAAIGESGLGAFGSYVGQQKERDAEELNILGKLADMDMAEQTLQARKDIANAAASAKARKPAMNFSALGKFYEDRYDDALAAYSDVAPDTGPNAGNVTNDEVLRRRQAVLDAHKTVTGHYASEGLPGPRLPFDAQGTVIKTNTGQ